MPHSDRVSIQVDDLELTVPAGGSARLTGPGVQLVVLMRHRH